MQKDIEERGWDPLNWWKRTFASYRDGFESDGWLGSAAAYTWRDFDGWWLNIGEAR